MREHRFALATSEDWTFKTLSVKNDETVHGSDVLDDVELWMEGQ